MKCLWCEGKATHEVWVSKGLARPLHRLGEYCYECSLAQVAMYNHKIHPTVRRAIA